MAVHMTAARPVKFNTDTRMSILNFIRRAKKCVSAKNVHEMLGLTSFARTAAQTKALPV